MKRFINILWAAATIFLVMILAVNLWMTGSRILLNNDMPKLLGYSHAVVLSGSMEPVFSVGDMLVFHEQEQYEIGDVVIFRQGGNLITHRIVEEMDGGFVTKGDANNTCDPELLDLGDIQGKLKWIVPKVGNVLGFLRTPPGVLLLAVVAFLCIEMPYLQIPFQRKREKHERKK